MLQQRLTGFLESIDLVIIKWYSRIFHRIPEICALSFNPNFFPSNSQFPFQEKNCKSRNRRIASSIGGDNGIPTLTPLQQDDVKRPRKQKLASVAGGVVAALLVIGFVVFVYICLMCVKRRIRRSEGESSVPSPSGKLTLDTIRGEKIMQINFLVIWDGSLRWDAGCFIDNLIPIYTNLPIVESHKGNGIT